MVDSAAGNKPKDNDSSEKKEPGKIAANEVDKTDSELEGCSFSSSLQQLLEPALGSVLTQDIKRQLLEHYGPNVKLTARKIQSIISPVDDGFDLPTLGDMSSAYNRFGRAYNRFGRAYNRFGRAYNRFAR